MPDQSQPRPEDREGDIFLRVLDQRRCALLAELCLCLTSRFILERLRSCDRGNLSDIERAAMFFLDWDEATVATSSRIDVGCLENLLDRLRQHLETRTT